MQTLYEEEARGQRLVPALSENTLRTLVKNLETWHSLMTGSKAGASCFRYHYKLGPGYGVDRPLFKRPINSMITLCKVAVTGAGGKL